MKSGIFAGIGLACAAGLAGCNQPEPAPPSPADAMQAIRFDNPRLALPAVKGNPGAVYFDVKNSGGADVAFGDPEVAGAQSAMLHGTSMNEVAQQAVKAGETVKFEPGGQHVMAMGLADTLKPGGTTKVTLHFTSGKTAIFPARIIAAGDDR